MARRIYHVSNDVEILEAKLDIEESSGGTNLSHVGAPSSAACYTSLNLRFKYKEGLSRQEYGAT
jgi:hypothetical protein